MVFQCFLSFVAFIRFDFFVLSSSPSPQSSLVTWLFSGSRSGLFFVFSPFSWKVPTDLSYYFCRHLAHCEPQEVRNSKLVGKVRWHHRSGMVNCDLIYAAPPTFAHSILSSLYQQTMCYFDVCLSCVRRCMAKPEANSDILVQYFQGVLPHRRIWCMEHLSKDWMYMDAWQCVFLRH